MRTRFVTSSASPAGFPSTALAELAFLGRSNVGKSSLLNALVGARIARTSRTPGRTQLINFFEAHAKDLDFMLADLPGLGYAKVPREVKASWRALIDGYLEGREPLRGLLFLLDMRSDAGPEEVELHKSLVELLAPRGVEIVVVGTKADKLSKAELKPTLHALARTLEIDRDAAIATSTSKNLGIDELRERIKAIAAR